MSSDPSQFFERTPRSLTASAALDSLNRQRLSCTRSAAEAQQLVTAAVARSAADVTAEVARAAARAAYTQSRTPRDAARVRLQARTDRVAVLGLSNPPYLHDGRADKKNSAVGAMFSPVAVVQEALTRGQLAASSSAPLASGRAESDVVAVPLRTWDVQRAELVQVGLQVQAQPAARLILALTPSRLRVGFTDQLVDHLTPGRGASGVGRGRVTELSAKSRDRLADMACTLTETGKIPEVMLTLTAPGEWRSLYIRQAAPLALDDLDGLDVKSARTMIDREKNSYGGRLFKAQMRAFRMRLERWFKKRGIMQFSALWFMEFQQRGAPHLHLMIFDTGMTRQHIKQMRSWIGRAWANIVDHPDKHEKQKHMKAGTQVARMRKPHFGYACKYASKAEQKEVPKEFEDVGRFWGVWNYKAPEAQILTFDYSHLNKEDTSYIRKLIVAALATIGDKSQSFMMNKLRKVMTALNNGLTHRFGFSVFGGEAARVVERLL